MRNIFKSYKSHDKQQDIFGEHYSFIRALHGKASRQYFNLFPLAFKILIQRLLRRTHNFKDKSLNKLLISVDPNQGRFLYNMILATKPKVVFEFGLSCGVSAMYICQALSKLKNDSKLFSTEIVADKIKIARSNLSDIKLDGYLSIIEGDILNNFDKIPDNIDFVHMDGYPNINLKVLKLLEPKLSKNAVIVTDDVNLFNFEMRDYLDYLNESLIYSNIKLNFSDGVLFTVKNN